MENLLFVRSVYRHMIARKQTDYIVSLNKKILRGSLRNRYNRMCTAEGHFLMSHCHCGEHVQTFHSSDLSQKIVGFRDIALRTSYPNTANGLSPNSYRNTRALGTIY
jgi:hypothetical protein